MNVIPNFEANPEDFESYFERAIEESDVQAKINRHMICQQFSEFETNFYQILYALESSFKQEQLEMLAEYKQELQENSALNEQNYMIFIYAKQCETFQNDLIAHEINVDELEAEKDIQTLVTLFIQHYPFLELVPPSIPLLGRFTAQKLIERTKIKKTLPSHI